MANPLLALQVQPSTIDVAGSLGRGQELQTQKLGNILQAYRLRKAQQDDEQANALSGFYKQHGAGIASGNDEDINALAAIDPGAALGFREKNLGIQDKTLGLEKTKGEIAKGQSEIETQHLKMAMDRAEFIGRSAAGILEAPPAARPLLYQRALAQAQEMGVDVSGAPQQYDENAVKGMMAQAITVKDRIAAHQQELTAAEAARHNKAQEGLTARGQNMADARAREAQLTGRIPTGYRAGPNGALEYIPGGPADPTRGAGKKAPTEDQAKNNQLYQRASQQLPIVLKHYDDLASLKNQIPRGIVGAVNSLPMVDIDPGTVTGTGGRQAENALKDIAASYLYSVSGATANPGEVKNLAETIMPKATDAKEVIDQKKARLQQMVESIKTRATPTADAPLPTGTKVIDFNELPDH